MFSTIANNYRVQACNSNSYGADAAIQGLSAAPCRPCPSGTETNTQVPSVNYRVGGAAQAETPGLPYTHPLACVTKPGYGSDGSVLLPCDIGYYSSGGSSSTCTQCSVGKTTLATGSNAESDCVYMPGWGKDPTAPALPVAECKLHYYSPGNTQDTCQECPSNRGTTETGAAAISNCDICKDGFGTASTGALQDGSVCSPCPSGKYSAQSDRDALDQRCLDCPDASTGFTFYYDGYNHLFAPSVISRLAANSSSMCIAEYAQLGDNLWNLWGALPPATNRPSCQTAQCCADACKSATWASSCHFFTFDYSQNDPTLACEMYTRPSNGAVHNAHLAYKAVPSAYVGASSVKAKSVYGMGSYTVWRVDRSDNDGLYPVPGISLEAFATASKSACMARCDEQLACALVYMEYTGSGNSDVITSCELRQGTVPNPGTSDAPRRSMTRAVSSFLVSV